MVLFPAFVVKVKVTGKDNMGVVGDMVIREGNWLTVSRASLCLQSLYILIKIGPVTPCVIFTPVTSGELNCSCS